MTQSKAQYLKQWLGRWQDELMVMFLYVSWFAKVQYECLVNFGEFQFNIFTAGEPMVVAIGFLMLKYIAVTFRSMKDVKMANDLEKQEDESA